MTPVDIRIDKEKFTDCSLRAQTCPSLIYKLKDKQTLVHEESTHYCIKCGQCIAVCGHDAIYVDGIDASSFEPLAPDPVTEEMFGAMSKARRSVRSYKKTPVEKDLVNRALKLASYAPMSFPPSQVRAGALLACVYSYTPGG